MTWTIIDKLWHQNLGRPYSLSKPIDEGSGPAVVLLHGLGRSGNTWQHVIEQLVPMGLRAVAFDLLGFGASPKPGWPRYDVDDHARAVIHSLRKLRVGQPVILVGHSMGCLVAVRVAKLRPDLVRHLVLYEMPLYEGLPEKRIYRLRTNIYLKLYRRITRYQPSFGPTNRRLAERLAKKITGFEADRETWLPFIRSLENTIVLQQTSEDIKQLDQAMDVIYGGYDMLVIRGKAKQFFGEKENLKAHTIRAGHVISTRASRFIVSRIEAALAA